MKRLVLFTLLTATTALAGIAQGATQHIRDGDTPPWPARPPVAIPAGYHADQGTRDGVFSQGRSGSESPIRTELAMLRKHKHRLISFLTVDRPVSYGKTVVTGRVVRINGFREHAFTRSATQVFEDAHAPGKAYTIGLLKVAYRATAPIGWIRVMYSWTVNPGPAQPAKPKLDPNDPCNVGLGCDANGNPIPDTP